MAIPQRAPRGSRRGAAAKPAKAAKKKATKPTTGKKTASSTTARRRPAVKPEAASRAAPRKRKAAARPASAVMPYLTVRNAAASLAFYEQAFGFKRGETVSAPEGSLIRVVMHHAGAEAFRFSPEGISSGSMQAPVTSGVENPIVLYVPCRKVDALAARAHAAGATIVSGPEDMFWGERIARIADPDGYVWCFAARLHKFDPDNMPKVAKAAQAVNGPDFDPWGEQATGPAPQQEQSSDLDFEL